MNRIMLEKEAPHPKRSTIGRQRLPVPYDAREIQAETYADQMVVIADDVDGMDVLYDMDGHPVAANNVRIQRHKLRVDSRKWIVSKLLRHRAGLLITKSARSRADHGLS